jgi:hypothetical protein
MRLFVICALAAAVLIILIGYTGAQDKSNTTHLKPDLPLEKPVPESADDPPEEKEQQKEPPPEEEIPPPNEDPPEDPPPNEEPPENPPPEFFEEPIEAAEVIFVIDRTGSMSWAAKLSVVDDETGRPLRDANKIDVARIELINTIKNLAETVKFAIVGYSCTSQGKPTYDTNWNEALRKWDAWPPAQEEPAPWGKHVSLGKDELPVWPRSKVLVEATPENKASAITWAKTMLIRDKARGLTCIYSGMSVVLKMVSPPKGKSKKSPTAVYLLTDGAPTHVDTAKMYFPSSMCNNDATWEQQCMDLTRAKVLAENTRNATIYTLGMGMDMSCPEAHVWNPAKNDWDYYPTEFNDRCRKFLTDLAEATGGHYREVSQ